MFTEVKDIVSLDVCRDGQSLSVTYLDPGRTQHTLIFRVDNAATAGGDGVRIYKSALIESLVTAVWKNPITCVSSANTVVRKTPVTWERAAEILLNLKPLMVNAVSGDSQVFQSMEQVASSDPHAVNYS